MLLSLARLLGRWRTPTGLEEGAPGPLALGLWAIPSLSAFGGPLVVPALLAMPVGRIGVQARRPLRRSSGAGAGDPAPRRVVAGGGLRRLVPARPAVARAVTLAHRLVWA
ncbi:MAG: hypothetical protein JXX28_01815 [Deltaproteobacteria bacterium]|nr:hypothetical protein [Deltaproteobacteria bacterium]